VREAGILPLNYSRTRVFSGTCLKAKALDPLQASLFSLCRPSVTLCLDREIDSITDSTKVLSDFAH
jgi:hypothetical protein